MHPATADHRGWHRYAERRRAGGAVVCATDEGSARIEELQFTLGEGPCVDAVRTGAPVLVPNLGEPNDLNVDRRPGFMEGAGAAGVRAVFAFPLRVGAINVGALDLYRNRPGALTAAQLSGALNQHTVTRSAGRHRLVTADVPSLHHSLRRAAQRSMARARLARVTSAPAQHLGP